MFMSLASRQKLRCRRAAGKANRASGKLERIYGREDLLCLGPGVRNRIHFVALAMESFAEQQGTENEDHTQKGQFSRFSKRS